jgi:hypothetical protein
LRAFIRFIERELEWNLSNGGTKIGNKKGKIKRPSTPQCGCNEVLDFLLAVLWLAPTNSLNDEVSLSACPPQGYLTDPPQRHLKISFRFTDSLTTRNHGSGVIKNGNQNWLSFSILSSPALHRNP